MHSVIFVILLWGTFFFAMAKGGRSERAAALIILIGVELSYFALPALPSRYNGIEVGVFIVDLIVFFALFGVALFSPKFWPMWVTAMQGVALVAHLSPALPEVIPYAYGAAVQWWSYPMLITLAIATRLHVRDQRRAAAPYRRASA